MPSTIARVRSRGARPPGTSAVVITTSEAATCSAMTSCSRARSSSLDLAGVAALGLGFLLHFLGGHERGAEALHLLPCGRPNVERLDLGSEPAGRGDGLQARHARAQHEHLRRGDRARRGHHHREELDRGVRPQERGLVAGHRAHGGEHVHALRPRDSRHELHGQRRHAPLGEPLQEVAVPMRIQQADEDGAGRELGDLIRPPFRPTWRSDPRHDPGASHQGARAGHLRARLPVGGVGEAGRQSGLFLDRHLVAGLDELARCIGRQRHPGLARGRLHGNGDSHLHLLPVRSREPADRRGARYGPGAGRSTPPASGRDGHRGTDGPKLPSAAAIVCPAKSAWGGGEAAQARVGRFPARDLRLPARTTRAIAPGIP